MTSRKKSFAVIPQAEYESMKHRINELEAAEIVPASKFLGHEMPVYLNKIGEELEEATRAYYEGETTARIIEELTDIQFAAETAIASLEPRLEARREMKRYVREKNERRGYNSRNGKHEQMLLSGFKDLKE